MKMPFLRLWTIILTCAIVLQFAVSCDYNPQKKFRHYLCSINADGTGFQRLYLNDYTVKSMGKEGSLYYNYLFSSFCGGSKLLLIFNDAIKTINHDGSGLLSVSNQQAFTFFNAVIPANDYNHAYYNNDTYLMQLDLHSGTKIPVMGGINSLYYPLASPAGDYIVTACYDSLVYLYDLASNETYPVQMPSNPMKAYYEPSTEKIIYLDNNGVISIVNRDGTGLRPLHHSNYSYYYAEQVMLPVLNGTKFLTNSNNSGQNKLILVNVADTTHQEIGNLYTHSNFMMSPSDGSNYAIDVCRNQKDVFFCDTYAIYRYDLTEDKTEVIFTTANDNYNCQNFTDITSSADGKKLYFICELYDYK
jgi:hypothetical protein